MNMRWIFMLALVASSLMSFKKNTAKDANALADGVYGLNRLVPKGTPIGILQDGELYQPFTQVYTENKVEYTGAVVDAKAFAELKPAEAATFFANSDGSKKLTVKLEAGSGDIAVQFFGGLPKKIKKVPSVNGVLLPVNILVEDAKERRISFSGGSEKDLKILYELLINKYL